MANLATRGHSSQLLALFHNSVASGQARAAALGESQRLARALNGTSTPTLMREGAMDEYLPPPLGDLLAEARSLLLTNWDETTAQRLSVGVSDATRASELPGSPGRLARALIVFSMV